MTKDYFESNVLMVVELDGECGKHRSVMKGSKVRGYLSNIGEDEGLSDIDYCTKQDDPEIQKILDAAHQIWRNAESRNSFKSYDEAIDYVLEQSEPKAKAKRVWTEEEIRNLVQTNDKVLYGALKKLYSEQTADEKRVGETNHSNGVGFNKVDSSFLSSVAEFLIARGYLTDKQKYATRKKLVKYNKQLTKLANAS